MNGQLIQNSLPITHYTDDTYRRGVNVKRQSKELFVDVSGRATTI